MIEQPAAHRRRRLFAVLLLLAVGAAGGAATFALRRDPRTAQPSAGGDPSGTGTGTVVGGADPAAPAGTPAAVGTFSIGGRAAGLVPGRRATLALTVTNPNPWPIHVLTLDTAVTGPPGARCPAATLDVARYAYGDGPRFTAPASGTVVVPVGIELTDSATLDQTGCAGVTFPLTMTGTAVRAP